MNARAVWRRLQQFVFHNILHLDDTPHRIAWGVLLGALIAFTPTLGLQIVFYVLVATLLSANKVSGIPILFVSNPFTAVPLYYTTWSVGAWVLHPENSGRVVTHDTIKTWLGDTGRALKETGVERLLDRDFWVDTGRVLLSTGDELWVGGFVLGILTGVPLYFVTRWGINAVRHLREGRGLPHGPIDPPKK
ncbi:MAG: DUF2062 domain-containing protein [Polyangiales bacterium]